VLLSCWLYIYDGEFPIVPVQGRWVNRLTGWCNRVVKILVLGRVVPLVLRTFFSFGFLLPGALL